MKLLKVMMAAGFLAVACAPPVLAQEPAKHEVSPEIAKSLSELEPGQKEIYDAERDAKRLIERAGNWGVGLGAGIAAGLTIIGAGLGIGGIGGRAVESMARQPEVAGNIQTAMIISAALIEGVSFFSLIVCILIVNNA